MSTDLLHRLADIIKARRLESPEASYTRKLLDGGAKRCAKKVGEEATELVIAALAEDNSAVAAEAADVLFHLLVLLECRGVGIDDVLAVLESRLGISGIVEKASRGAS
jgi:phosphoribosyl-ATP pyrophosphohydrolase